MKTKQFVVGVLVVLTTILFPFAQAWGQTNSATNVARLLGIKPLSINGVPDALPIGSEKIVRDFIVGINGVGVSGFIEFSFIQNGQRKGSTEGQACDGYESYEEFVNSMLLLAETKIVPFWGHSPGTVSYTPGTDVRITANIVYHSGPAYSTGLYISKKVGPFESITEEKIRDALSLKTDVTTEQLIFSVPDLKRQHITVVMEDGTTNTYEWTASGGEVGSPTWPMLESTTNGWVALRGWYCTGKYSVRITIETAAGAKAVYTEFGEKLLPPILRMVDKQTLEILVAQGAFVDIYTSTDNSKWTLAQSVKSVDAYGFRVQIDKTGPQRFYKVTCR